MAKPKRPAAETTAAGRIEKDFPIQGLDCADCARLLEKAVAAVNGVELVQADLLKSSLKVAFAPQVVPAGEIVQAIQRAGFTVPAELNATTLVVAGLDCPEEEKIIRQALGSLPGIAGMDFYLVSGTLTVHYQSALLGPEAIIAALNQAGFQAGVRKVELAIPPRESRTQLILLILCGLLTGAGFVLSWADFPEAWANTLFGLAIATGGGPMVRKALIAARNVIPDMNLLMTVAVAGAVVIQEWTEAAAVVFLFLLANILERYSMARTRRAIRSLLELSPPEARVRREEREMLVPVADVRVGETILIFPGEKIPLDGEVLEGSSTANQAPITGESVPVRKGPGDAVFAGSINGRGALGVRVSHLAGDTTLARIIHLVEEAQARKAPSQSFVDSFARYYTPAVIVAAVLVMAVPPVVLAQPFTPWFYRALVLLVIACPCALVISTPVAVVSGLAGAARRGILIKGGIHLEQAGTIRVMAFDKTGTLTRGEPVVSRVTPFGAWTANQVLAVAAALESRSEHHLAQAILNHARLAGIELSLKMAEFEAMLGRGVKARINGQTYYVGNEQLFADLGLNLEEVRIQVAALESEAQTVIMVGSSQGLMGLIVVADTLRPEAAAAMERLRQIGMEKLVMLTGDNPSAARAVTESLGLDLCFPGLMPGDKVGVVQGLLAEGNQVAMVGDGVNDAPALASATLGIAMGAAGSDAAIEAADIALMSDDLGKLPELIQLGRQARRTIKTNIILSLAIKAVFLGLGTAGLATLWMAVFADMGTSLLVIGNGLRLYRPNLD